MFRSVASAVCILSVLLAAISAPSNSFAFGSADYDDNEPVENQAVQVYSDVVIIIVRPRAAKGEDTDDDDSRAVTPYGYKALMLQNSSSGRKVDCWRCSSPCSAYLCCNNGFPQCCLDRGICKCCRSL